MAKGVLSRGPKSPRRGGGHGAGKDGGSSGGDDDNRTAPPSVRLSPAPSGMATPTSDSPALLRRPSASIGLFDAAPVLVRRPSNNSNIGDEDGAPPKAIAVCVRVRPLADRERHANPQSAWNWEGDTIAQSAQAAWEMSSTSRRDTTSRHARPQQYSFDHLFPPEARTERIYGKAVKKVVLAAMEGYHGTVFAYGQTGSGKTHTMQGTRSEPGVIRLAVEECFARLATADADRDYLFRMSYLEIYNEQINDLLCPAGTNLRIFDGRDGVSSVRGLKEEVVISPEQIYALIAAGEAQRHVGATDANLTSSRSHTIFRLTIERVGKGGAAPAAAAAAAAAAGSGVAGTSRRASAIGGGLRGAPPRRETVAATAGAGICSSLSLVDLAGSESARLSNTTGERALEGSFINKSLLTLGHIIYKLTEDRPHSSSAADGGSGGGGSGAAPAVPRHLPYRDSKLTRYLQSSLGGNAHIAIICTVTPAVTNMEETHNTLKFASRAKRIKSNAVVNEVTDERLLIKKYREEIALLKEQLARAQAEAAASTGSPAGEAASAATAAPSAGKDDEDDDADDDFADEWLDAEAKDGPVQLKNTILQLERLILSSRSQQAPRLEHQAQQREGREAASGGVNSDGGYFTPAGAGAGFGTSQEAFPVENGTGGADYGGSNAGGGGGGGRESPRLGLGAASSFATLGSSGDGGGDDGFGGRSTLSGPEGGAVSAIPAVAAGAGVASGTPGGVEFVEDLEKVHGNLRDIFSRLLSSKKHRGRSGGESGDAYSSPRHRNHHTSYGDADAEVLRGLLDEKEEELRQTHDALFAAHDELEAAREEAELLSCDNRQLHAEKRQLDGEVARLTSVLAAREAELCELKGLQPDEETF